MDGVREARRTYVCTYHQIGVDCIRGRHATPRHAVHVCNEKKPSSSCVHIKSIKSDQVRSTPPDYSQLPSPVPAGLKAGAETTRRLPASFKATSAPKKEFWPMNCPCESGFGLAVSGMEDGMYVRSIPLLMSCHMLYLQLRGGVDPGAVPLDVVVDEG